MIDLDAMSKDPWPTWPVDKNELRGLVKEIERLRGTHPNFDEKPMCEEAAAEIERLLLIEQGSAEPCDTCGWRMKFPNAECRNCENAKLRDEIERLRAALRAIAAYDTDADGNWGFFRDEADAALAEEASDDAAT